jgi:hypothetical protein
MTRKVLWPVLVIGALLIVLPFAFQMPSRTAAGDRMMSDFQPLMGAAHVQQTADYYYKVFVPLGGLADQFLKMPASNPMAKQLAPAAPILRGVGPGLAWYKPLVTTMQGNVNDYESVNALPSFRLFTWFFVIPGVLLVLLSGFGLWYEHREVAVGRIHPTPA